MRTKMAKARGFLVFEAPLRHLVNDLIHWKMFPNDFHMKIIFILSLRCIARFLMNPENPPPYTGPGPTAPYPPYPQQPMGPMGAPPPQGYPYPPPQGYPYQGYPQYGWQGGPQEPPKTTGRCL